MDKTKIAVDLFDQYATEYQEKFMDVAMYGASLDLFCNLVHAQNAAVLDVACGPGNITHYVLQKRPDFKILGIDLAPKMIALAQQNNPSAAFQVMDIKQIAQLEQPFDAIIFGFCLPYLSREEAIQLIHDAAQIMKPQGVLYLSTMEDDYSTSGIRKSSQGDEMFMYFHEAGYLLEALKANGFEVVDLRRQPYPPEGELVSTDLLIVATLV
jgi:trans-aconitate methyltransferase